MSYKIIVDIHTGGMYNEHTDSMYRWEDSMARNKYPEETRNLIIDTAAKLFIDKGYDNTSVQDIIDNLGGLSKGAIYHHFKSKEDIMNAASDKFFEEADRKMEEICKRTDINGREKIKQMLYISFFAPAQEMVFTAAPDILHNPKLLSLYLLQLQKEVPEIIEPLIEEGVADGSIQTEYPKELAEVFMLLGNIWLNPMIYQCSPEETMRKMKYYQHVLKQLGMDIVEDDIFVQLKKYTEIYEERRER